MTLPHIISMLIGWVIAVTGCIRVADMPPLVSIVVIFVPMFMVLVVYSAGKDE